MEAEVVVSCRLQVVSCSGGKGREEFAVRMCIEIDDQLMQDALRLSGLRTKKAVVAEARRLFAEMDPRDAKRFVQEYEQEKLSRRKRIKG